MNTIYLTGPTGQRLVIPFQDSVPSESLDNALTLIRELDPEARIWRVDETELEELYNAPDTVTGVLVLRGENGVASLNCITLPETAYVN